MVDVHKAFHSAGLHARHVQRNGMRLLFSGIGFSAAYFLDPELGPARRRQALVLLRRARAAVISARTPEHAPSGPPSATVDSPVPTTRTAGSPRSTEVLKIAR